VVQKIDPERLSFIYLTSLRRRSHYSEEPPTLVEFKLEQPANGTLLLLTESGFDKIPAGRRLEAFPRNDGGWTEQMKNIETYVV
jgi:activator of Hsp90 ATPase-like protein